MTVSKMDSDAQRDKFAQWLSDGESWIGVFENRNLSSPRAGERVAFCFDVAQYDDAEIGMRAPDVGGFIGWAFGLVEKCTTVDQALAAMAAERVEDA